MSETTPEASATHEDADARRDRWVDRALVSVFGLLYGCVVLTSSGVVDGRRSFTLFDDAMISMRYGRNLAEGSGLVYNAGEQVEGYTNLLWTVVMAGVHLVVSDVHRTSLVVSAIGIVVLCVQLHLVARLTRAATDVRWAPWLAMATVGTNYALAFWTLRGMEVGLVGLLVLGAIAVTHLWPEWSDRRRGITLAALLLAAVFTRDDALVPVAVVLLFAVLALPAERRRRGLVLAAAAVGATLALRVGVRWALYGELLPNTYVLKVDGVPRELLLERGAASVALLCTFGLAVPLALAVLGLGSSAIARTCTAVVAAQLLYSVGVGGDAWEYFGFANRFAATATAPLAIAAVLGLVAAREGRVVVAQRVVAIGMLALSLLGIVAVTRTSSYFGLGHGAGHEDVARALTLVAAAVAILAARTRAGVVVLGATLVLAGNVVPWVDWVGDPGSTSRSDTSWAEYGNALGDATTPDTLIAASAIGNLGYFSDRPIADILGKIDPEIAHREPHLERWLIPGHSKWDLEHTVGGLQPEVVAQLFAAEDADIEWLESAGYLRLGPYVFLRGGTDLTAADLERAVDIAY
ncbi:MAG: hypothetical protein ACK4V6_16775 [Microthrixaceae bacterium]